MYQRENINNLSKWKMKFENIISNFEKFIE